MVDFIKNMLNGRIIKEQKIVKIVKQAHNKEQRLLKKLLNDCCDNDYIITQIKNLMQNEIRNGIKKHFPTHEVYFSVKEVEEDSSEVINNNINEQKQSEMMNNFKNDISNKENKVINFLNKIKNNHFKHSATHTPQIDKKDLMLIEYNQNGENRNNKILADDFEYNDNDYNSAKLNNELNEVKENSLEEAPKGEYWIINELDGYKNDKNRIPNYTTSLCFVNDGKIKYSVVFDWYTKDIYYAIKDNGAYLNNKRIRVSQRKEIKESIIAFRNGSKGLNDNIELQKILTPLVFQMETFSNVAIQMCFVASGKVDGCVDVAVNDLLNYKIGKLIVEESGGKVTNLNGNEFKDSNNILATNNYIHSQILMAVKTRLMSSKAVKFAKIAKTAIKMVSLII